jgi:hypothetical protein
MASPAAEQAREFEPDGVVLTLGALAFAGIATLLYFALAYASGAGVAPVAIASIIVAALIVGSWLLAYPHRATAVAIALVLLAAIIYLPRIFVLDGALLREASGMSGSRLRVAIGLNVGGVFVGFLVLVVFGFLLPLINSLLALRRRLPGSSRRFDIHVRAVLGAIVLVMFPFSSFYDDLSFALLKPAREEAVKAMSEIYINTSIAPAERFPRIACCNNTIRVTENGDRLLFLESENSGAHAVIYERNTPAPGPFRVLRDYGGGWKLVEFNSPSTPTS